MITQLHTEYYCRNFITYIAVKIYYYNNREEAVQYWPAVGVYPEYSEQPSEHAFSSTGLA